MTKFFGGNSLAAFGRTSEVNDGDTTAGRFDSAYVSSGIHVLSTSTSAYIRTPTFSATGDLWIRCDIWATTDTSSDRFPIQVFNGVTEAYRIRKNNSTFTLGYWNGSAWVEGTPTVAANLTTLTTVVLKISLNSEIRVYINGTEIAAAAITGITTGQTAATHVHFSGTSNTAGSAGTVYSQIMGADYDIRDAHIMPSVLNGNSAANTGAASGVYTDVNETVLNDATAISITASANKAGQTHAGITLPSGYVIAAAVVAARGRHDGVITDGKLGIRSGGANYSSAGLSYGTNYGPKIHIIEDDPATSSPFTQSGFNSAEPYLEAA